MERDLPILVSGLGIAGPAAAFWLRHLGYSVEIVERAPHLRTGGYAIDVWGLGYEALDRMDLAQTAVEHGYRFAEVREVDDQGHRRSGIDGDTISNVLHGRFITLIRSELSRILANCVEDVPVRFDDSVSEINDKGDRVAVTFESGAQREYALVIGAGGLHSRVRELVFGPGGIVPLGYRVASFLADGYPHREEGVYVGHTEKGRQLARYALRGDQTAFLLIWRDESAAHPPRDLVGQKREIIAAFDGMTWEWPEVRQWLERAPEIYYDLVAQTHLPCWSKGRVVLIGDAAACPSLLAGEGSAMAMTAANILAAKLRDCKDHRQAFEEYEHCLRDPFEKIQKGALAFGGAFAPKTDLGLWFRNAVMNLMNAPLVGPIMAKRAFLDRFDWPEDALRVAA
jgi:2-polyprenyl-6-methoxyphenol hydroxylase-like FAD-dependent oxidoreductase